VARFALWVVLLAVLLPNVAASAFNYTYNWFTIVKGHKDREQVFQYAAIAVNGIGFPVGIGIVVMLAWPLAKGFFLLRAREKVPSEGLRELRWRCLYLGHLCAGIGVLEWLLAGPVYPVSIGLWGEALQAGAYAYFIVSLALGGLIAASYPFFLVTFLCVRVFYLPLVRPGGTTAEDRDALERLLAFTWRYLLLAASVPMIAMTLAVTPLSGASSQPYLLWMLGLGGLAGLGLAYWLCRAIQRDLEVLKIVVARSRPGRSIAL
jgi:hypothetical protein